MLLKNFFFLTFFVFSSNFCIAESNPIYQPYQNTEIHDHLTQLEILRQINTNIEKLTTTIEEKSKNSSTEPSQHGALEADKSVKKDDIINTHNQSNASQHIHHHSLNEDVIKIGVTSYNKLDYKIASNICGLINDGVTSKKYICVIVPIEQTKHSVALLEKEVIDFAIIDNSVKHYLSKNLKTRKLFQAIKPVEHLYTKTLFVVTKARSELKNIDDVADEDVVAILREGENKDYEMINNLFSLNYFKGKQRPQFFATDSISDVTQKLCDGTANLSFLYLPYVNETIYSVASSCKIKLLPLPYYILDDEREDVKSSFFIKKVDHEMYPLKKDQQLDSMSSFVTIFTKKDSKNHKNKEVVKLITDNIKQIRDINSYDE